MQLSELNKDVVQKLNANNIESSSLDTKVILKEVLKIQDRDLILDKNINVNPLEDKLIKDMVEERINRKPLSRIIGRREFFSLEFEIDDSVLDPRPETEHLVEEAINLIQKNEIKNILELGVGSGCVIISILKICNGIKGFGVDISKDAIVNAKLNLTKNKLDDCHLVVSDWGKSLNMKFDLIVSNPPYIKSSDLAYLPKEVCNYDPSISLNGGYDGLESYRKIAKQACDLLTHNGFIVIEIGYDQAKDVSNIFNSHDFKLLNKVKDYSDLDRILIFSKKKIKKQWKSSFQEASVSLLKKLKLFPKNLSF